MEPLRPIKLQTVSHLVELQQQDQTRPRRMIGNQHEDAEQPGGAACQCRAGAPQALLLITQRAVNGPV